MPPDPFHHRVSISPEHLRVERFVETRKVESFDCGNRDLNEYLCTKEVGAYQEAAATRLTRRSVATTLLRRRGSARTLGLLGTDLAQATVMAPPVTTDPEDAQEDGGDREGQEQHDEGTVRRV